MFPACAEMLEEVFGLYLEDISKLRPSNTISISFKNEYNLMFFGMLAILNFYITLKA